MIELLTFSILSIELFSLIFRTQPPFIDWVIGMSNDPNAPWVYSVSYGEVEQQVPSTTTSRFNTEIQKMAVRGITVLVSSG